MQGHPNIRRLFENFVEMGKIYNPRGTGSFPIMHIIAIKRELLDRNPWVAMNLFKAFEEAKNRSLERALFVGSRYPIPWSYEYARQAQELLGKDFWPYGIERNPSPSTHFCNTPTSRVSAIAACSRKNYSRRKFRNASRSDAGFYLLAPPTIYRLKT